MRHIIPISGKDSLATALVQHTRHPEHNYEFVFNPTGLEVPEVYEWINKVEKHFGKSVIKVGRSLKDIIIEKNYFLPSGKNRYCTSDSKIFPFIDWIGKDECCVYYGIRSDEQRDGFNNTLSPNINPVYPLRELNIDLNTVYTIINNFNLKPPVFFWESVYMEVTNILGFDPKKILKEWQFDMLFAWRSRANCDRCFNQRRYEWVGLLEHHPDRFWEAESWEHLGGEQKYYWMQDLPLSVLAENAAVYKKKRIDVIVKQVRLFMQLSLFKELDDQGFIDILSVKSCGLFCGK